MMGYAFHTMKLGQYDVLAYGGRFDNKVAHYMPIEYPIAVGFQVNCSKLITAILNYESRRRGDYMQAALYPIDVLIVSRGDMVTEKLELLNELWRYNIRAEADFKSDFSQPELSQNVRSRF